MKNTEAKFNLQETSSLPPQAAADDHVDSNNDHQSAQLIGSNDDLLNEILHRLPAKSILRFKSVSKQWLTLLTHPRFTLLFDKLLKSAGLYYHELHASFDVENPSTPPFRCLDFSPADTHGFRIVQSCNGLLLCCCDKDYKCSGNYYVFNPTTNKFALIPRVIGSPRDDELIRFMGLAYHPTECVHYKLVCILRAGHTSAGEGLDEEGNRMYKIQIYSSHTRKWKKLKLTFTPLRCYNYFRFGVYWNGAFHWAPSCPNPMYLRLDNEEIQDLPLPSPLPVLFPSSRSQFYMPLYFGESRGRLHWVDIADNKNPLSMNVYEMPRDHSGWFIKYQLDLSQLCAAYPNMVREFTYDFSVLDLVRGEEEEDTFMVVNALNSIKRYNILDQSFQQLFWNPKIEDIGKIRYTEAHRYIEKIGSF